MTHHLGQFRSVLLAAAVLAGVGASTASADLPPPASGTAASATAKADLATRLNERRPIIPLPPTLLSGIVGLAFIAAKTIGRPASAARVF